jgi:hypothetical protein
MSSPRAVSSHQHVQSTPSTLWSIEHGLYCNPVVSVIVLDESNKLVGIIPSSVKYVSPTLVEITFTSLRTGEARLS